MCPFLQLNEDIFQTGLCLFNDKGRLIPISGQRTLKRVAITPTHMEDGPEKGDILNAGLST
ncbi:hypothetical protein UCMB321_2116 [Pseudomonas batumici]|uniref:Uncharacterized protein n=1 Tax=Pseudomonas batumici TaxID=226910 RepID=A0A0C2I4H4_9PSED|nr:hypothetical protein UCMB321_2116 [Pseudomonas batumici]